MHGSLFGFEITWWATIALLGFFTVLTIMGISESASVAIGIFVTHMATLTLLILIGLFYVFFSDQGLSTWNKNWSDPLHVHVEEKVQVDDPTAAVGAEPTYKKTFNYKKLATPIALFFGFSIALLGISGFESSANFVEEQEDGVFPKTLRNMWMCVSFFNPAMAFLALALIPIDTVQTESKYQLGLLAEMGRVAGGGKGSWLGGALANLISIDAVLVLSGAVLTSFVGANGLVRRMALDRCLPQFLLKQSSRGTTHRILISFFLLCVSVNWIATKERKAGAHSHAEAHASSVEEAGPEAKKIVTDDGTLTHSVALVAAAGDGTEAPNEPAASNAEPHADAHTTGAGAAAAPVVLTGDVDALAGVYTISFLTVMALFAVGNILLKIKRDKLPRPVRASWAAVIIAITAVLIGLVGNAARNPRYLQMFLYYFVPAMAFIGLILYRIPLLKLCMGAVEATLETVTNKIEEINSQQVVFFTRGDNVSNLNNAMQYVLQNEDTNRIKVVTVLNKDDDVPDKLADDLKFLDEAYPQIDIEYVKRIGKFGPELIQELSDEWNVPTNLMFIGSPGGKMPYGLAELGGVRLII